MRVLMTDRRGKHIRVNWPSVWFTWKINRKWQNMDFHLSILIRVCSDGFGLNVNMAQKWPMVSSRKAKVDQSVPVPPQWSMRKGAYNMNALLLPSRAVSAAGVWAGLQEKLVFIAIVTWGFPVIIANNQNETRKCFTRKHVYYESECSLRA